MANRTHKISGAAVLGLALLSGRQAMAQAQPVALTVRVYAPFANLIREDLAEAEARSTKTYEAIGVKVHWVHENHETEALDPETYQVRLVLLSGAKARQEIALRHVDEGVLGQAAG